MFKNLQKKVAIVIETTENFKNDLEYVFLRLLYKCILYINIF